MENFREINGVLKNLREGSPLVHHITNYVTVNDCANVTLAIGASPVMADDINEVYDMVSIASSLVINIGTLNSRTIESMLIACKRANELNIPIVLDPVGAGATPYRTGFAKKLLKEVKFSVIRGNLSEIKTLYGINSKTKGVDSVEEISDKTSDFKITKDIVKSFSKEIGSVVAVTGAIDVISDGNKVYTIKNGNKAMSKITGTGCMCTSLIGSYLGATKNNLIGAILGILTMGIAGDIAFKNLKDLEGSGSLKVKIIDAIYNMNEEMIKEMGILNEE